MAGVNATGKALERSSDYEAWFTPSPPVEWTSRLCGRTTSPRVVGGFGFSGRLGLNR